LARDQHPTPPKLVSRLLTEAARVLESSPSIVADFAAGDGRLLHAAADRWPKAKIVAVDTDPLSVQALEQENTTWRVYKGDFLSQRVGSRLAAATPANLVLLNPPFSYRGGRVWKVPTKWGTCAATPAGAFLVRAFEMTARKGTVAAIMPSSFGTSQRDVSARLNLSRDAVLTLVSQEPRGTFPSAVAATAIYVVTPSSQPVSVDIPEGPFTVGPKQSVRIIRGALPVHRARLGQVGLPFVHTTGLRHGRVQQSLGRVLPRQGERLVDPGAVLIPRVGKPDARKVAVYRGDGPIVMSDCVFALTESRDPQLLANALVANWDYVVNCYAGSCAPYLTVRRLERLLRQVGWRAMADAHHPPRAQAARSKSAGESAA
jgi:hypothetical protein